MITKQNTTKLTMANNLAKVIKILNKINLYCKEYIIFIEIASLNALKIDIISIR